MPEPQPKVTSQNAPLEKFLTWQRTKRILNDVRGKAVLDFGCGAHLTTLKSIAGVTTTRIGLDIRFLGKGPVEAEPGIFVVGSLEELDVLLAQRPFGVDCITSLACFEHLEHHELLDFLQAISFRCAPSTQIVGTVPTPWAKPVLEFLSYRLKLIDESQIRDHKVYYDRAALERVAVQAGWEMAHYSRFQFGMNSYFRLRKGS